MDVRGRAGPHLELEPECAHVLDLPEGTLITDIELTLRGELPN